MDWEEVSPLKSRSRGISCLVMSMIFFPYSDLYTYRNVVTEISRA
jgi:hypothetical protein